MEKKILIDMARNVTKLWGVSLIFYAKVTY
jgi:hypothetical protein